MTVEEKKDPVAEEDSRAADDVKNFETPVEKV